jgi:hypothetical protein
MVEVTAVVAEASLVVLLSWAGDSLEVLLSWAGDSLLVLLALLATLVVVSWAGPVLVLPPGATVLVEDTAVVVWPAAVVVVVAFTSEVVVALEVEVFLVVVLGGLVLDAVLQSNEMVGTWMLQLGLGLLGWGGKTMVTFLAPPHWLLTTVVPDWRQELRCLQVEPSGMS